MSALCKKTHPRLGHAWAPLRLCKHWMDDGLQNCLLLICRSAAAGLRAVPVSHEGPALMKWKLIVGRLFLSNMRILVALVSCVTGAEGRSGVGPGRSGEGPCLSGTEVSCWSSGTGWPCCYCRTWITSCSTGTGRPAAAAPEEHMAAHGHCQTWSWSLRHWCSR